MPLINRLALQAKLCTIMGGMLLNANGAIVQLNVADLRWRGGSGVDRGDRLQPPAGTRRDPMDGEGIA